MKKLLILIIGFCFFSCKKGIYFGNEFKVSSTATVDSVMAIIKKDSITPELNLKGNIDLVCQSKGCWFTFISSDGEILRVMVKDDKFLIPKKIKAKTAICKGKGKKMLFSPEKLKEIYSQAGYPKKDWDTIQFIQTHYIFETTAIFLE